MKRTYKRELILDKPSFDLNKSSSGCAPCLREVSKIDRQVNGRSLNQIRINEIKTIVRSIFDEKNDTKN